MDLVTFLQRLTELKREIHCLSVAIRCCRDSFGLQLPGTLLSVIGSFMLFRESASFAEVNKNWNSIAATNLFQKCRSPALKLVKEIQSYCYTMDAYECDCYTHRWTRDGKFFWQVAPSFAESYEISCSG